MFRRLYHHYFYYFGILSVDFLSPTLFIGSMNEEEHTTGSTSPQDAPVFVKGGYMVNIPWLFVIAYMLIGTSPQQTTSAIAPSFFEEHELVPIPAEYWQRPGLNPDLKPCGKYFI